MAVFWMLTGGSVVHDMSKHTKKIETIAFVSLGCPKNLVDSERMLGLLAGDGLTVTSDASQADAIIINTCGFLEASKVESLEAIREAAAMKKTGRCQRLVVAGCLVQRHKARLLAEVPEIDRLVGVFDREHIVQAVKGKANPANEGGHWLGQYHQLAKRAGTANEHGTRPARVFEDDRSRLRLTPRHYAYLRMSEGCNQGCSFCTIPAIRGPLRSKPVDQILTEAKELASDGTVELNLIGQDTTSYGVDIGYRPGLSGLLRAIDRAASEVHWVRLMYAYPSCFPDELIRTIAECPRIVKYIDLPLQHISDPILKRMKRRVTRIQIERLLQKLRSRVPGIAIRTTFISGVPGETARQHKELVKFVREFGFDMMGVFAYSRESGTPMARMDGQISEHVKKARVEELMLVQQQVAFSKAAAMKGRTIEVLIDRRAGRNAADGWVARSQSQAPEIDSVVLVPGTNLHAGQFVDVTVTGADGYDLIAEPAKPKRRPLVVLK